MLLRASLRFTCSLYTNKLMLNTLFFISSNESFLCGFASRVGQSNAFKEHVWKLLTVPLLAPNALPRDSLKRRDL